MYMYSTYTMSCMYSTNLKSQFQPDWIVRAQKHMQQVLFHSNICNRIVISMEGKSLTFYFDLKPISYIHVQI